ncbi:tannase/feruloyl esterase family alpha/beta hydrolase [Aquabacterium sp.]|uniref:tannase/feruloyl esterase family alpha/beta hydrolase n=1 Tax=Aquabacterium sp. TaxID=1872578 RepID=UPI002CBCF195|nr:tannase/feruloyl esterase family alpha/beta hydrolase [Aquabacterium sp.]HSW04555.1 tannase/feruloyl esterase family alpha/beta hydrolase [Aquabacterium sp.]
MLKCADLTERFQHADTRLTKVEALAEGAVKPPGIVEAMPAHCVVSGAMEERTSPVDGKRYAISFEMRLPTAWNGRFFYQANGGLDGFVTPAYGDTLGGGPRSNALQRGFAVISSDAGHALERNVPGIGGGTFGIDPQARLNYGYQAVAKLTPMAHALIARYYGRPADTSYLVGTSNGGRHGFVAAARDTGRYDGIAVVTPGWRLPRAALAQVWGAQQFAKAAPIDAKTGRPDLKASISAADMALVSARVLAHCDALDGLVDGIVADTIACQRQFDIQRDVPTCAAAAPNDGCLSTAQKTALAAVFAGPTLRDGRAVYAPLAWDAGLRGTDWRTWKLEHSVGPRDAVAMAYVFSTPPASPTVVSGQGTTLQDFALGLDVERGIGIVDAVAAPYTESAMQFMTPPDAQRMASFVARGAKLLVAHGVADPVFSALDSVNWYEAFRAHHGASTERTTRLYLVPGMNHSRGGIATDQFDLLTPLVAWVERGEAPQALIATARGPGSNLPNPELPANWSAQRTRLLCPFPQVARYRGQGDGELAANFHCVAP